MLEFIVLYVTVQNFIQVKLLDVLSVWSRRSKLIQTRNLTEPGVVALERILFVLPRIGSTLEFLLMWPLRAKFARGLKRWKMPTTSLARDGTGRRGPWKRGWDAEVYRWGRQIFPISPPQKQKSTTCKRVDCVFIYGIWCTAMLFGKASKNLEKVMRCIRSCFRKANLSPRY